MLFREKSNPKIIYKVTQKWIEGEGVQHYFAQASDSGFYARILKDEDGKYWAGLRELELLEKSEYGVVDLDSTALSFTIPQTKKSSEKKISKTFEKKTENFAKKSKKKDGSFWESI